MCSGFDPPETPIPIKPPEPVCASGLISGAGLNPTGGKNATSPSGSQGNGDSQGGLLTHSMSLSRVKRKPFRVEQVQAGPIWREYENAGATGTIALWRLEAFGWV